MQIRIFFSSYVFEIRFYGKNRKRTLVSRKRSNPKNSSFAHSVNAGDKSLDFSLSAVSFLFIGRRQKLVLRPEENVGVGERAAQKKEPRWGSWVR